MDEDEPGAVDARSIYIGNVRAHLIHSIPFAPNYQHLLADVCDKSAKHTNGLRGVCTMNRDHKHLS